MLGLRAHQASRQLLTRTPLALQSAGALRLVPVNSLRTTALSRKEATVQASVDPTKSKSQGSRHWSIERGLAAATLVLVPAAVVVPSAPVDYALGVVIPLHAYFGLESMMVWNTRTRVSGLGLQSAVTDYLPQRKFKIGYHVALNSVRVASLLAAYGLYELNANDIGITNAVKALWSL